MNVKFGSWITIGCLGLIGCAGTNPAMNTRQRLTALPDHDVPADVRTAILAGRVTVGMSDGMVAASWGLPRNVTVDNSPGVHREMWAYGTRITPGWETTLTLEEGTVVNMEQTRVRGVVGVWDPPAESYRAPDPHTVPRLEPGLNR